MPFILSAGVIKTLYLLQARARFRIIMHLRSYFRVKWTYTLSEGGIRMNVKIISQTIIEQFLRQLREEEKSVATIEKYIRDVKAFSKFINGAEITKDAVIAYKQHLLDEGYAARSVNSMLASINSLFRFLGWTDLRVKPLRIQQQAYCAEEKELTRSEYERLCCAARRKRK